MRMFPLCKEITGRSKAEDVFDIVDRYECMDAAPLRCQTVHYHNVGLSLHYQRAAQQSKCRH